MKPRYEKYEIPVIAWNDVQSGIQVAQTLTKKHIIRVDSIPKIVNTAALKDQMRGLDLTWLSLRGLKEALGAMVTHGKINHTDSETAFLRVSDAVSRFTRTFPGRRVLKNQRQILEIASKRGYDPYEVKADLIKLAEAGQEFFNILSAPVERLYSPVAALRRSEAERRLLRGFESVAAMQRRMVTIPKSIAAADTALEKIRARIRRLASLAVKTETRAQQLRGEQAELAVKLEARGVTTLE